MEIDGGIDGDDADYVVDDTVSELAIYVQLFLGQPPNLQLMRSCF
jgi:hypothetical protein